MEVRIILILLMAHLIGLIFSKNKSQVLSCGIFGWAGKTVKSFDKAKFDIQGLYNNSRGGDSCGVSTDGEIYYGITTSKDYSSFLRKQGYEAPLSVPVVIGHTRKSSSGTVNSDNAHPFGFGDFDKKFEFVGVHNGTLHNQIELAKNHNLETDVREKNNFGANIFKRTKIDSEILLEIIHNEKSFKVLSEYIGGAALLFTNLKEPNVLYVFKGASRYDSYDRDLDIEERPLYYYKEHKNSLYISSLQESLEAIGGVANQNLYKFDQNTVYRIKDGNIDLAEKIEISRKKAFQRPSSKKDYDFCGYSFNKNSHKNVFDRESVSEKKGESVIRIQDEKEVKFFKSTIIFNRLRYTRNGHLISGVYTWVNSYGFVYLASDHKNAEIEISKIYGKAFDLEYGYFAHYDDPSQDDENIIFPFTNENKKVPGLFYFYEGVLLETKLDFEILNSKLKNYTIWDLSEMSKHPVVELSDKNKSSHIYPNIIHKRVSFTGNIAPLGSGRIYYIEKGFLTKTIELENALNVRF